VNVAIVDDEPLSRDLLDRLLADQADITVVGRYKNGREAIKGLQAQPVDVVFLDIQMPGLNGFDVVKELQADTMPLVVFATAHSEFAVDAFELHAVDYVLKPFSPERIAEALSRCHERLAARALAGDGDASAEAKAAAIAAAQSGGQSHTEASSIVRSTDVGRLAIKDGSQTQLVVMDDIAWIDAAGDYMCVHASGETHILRSTMKELEERLPDNFVRIHRSTIVNLRKVEAVDGLPKGEAQLHIVGGGLLMVSRNYRQAIQGLLS